MLRRLRTAAGHVAKNALPAIAAAAVLLIVMAAARTTPQQRTAAALPVSHQPATLELNGLLADRWADDGLPAPEAADDLTVLRRLSLALHGTVPSLEEIREFEADDAPNRLRRWTRRMIEDPRYGRYFAERLARPLVGVEPAPFVVFRRDRLTAWMAERIGQDQPWDQTVRHLIADEGIWTDTPAVNFITKQVANDDLDVDALTARTVRAFLGQRIDCAQCHDHPFDKWKQSEFEGLAAFYGQTGLSIGGVTDNPEAVYTVQDRETLEDRVVDPSVPFGEDWLTDRDRRRLALADWITAEQNARFDRAIANRVWTLMMGRPFVSTRPVDDLPDPADPVDRLFDEPDEWAGLDFLADDFRASGRRISRLVEVIAASDAFRASSRSELYGSDLAAAEESWAVRPLARLRPEQVIGSMIQASSVRTVDPDSHLFVRILRLVRENDFVKDFGDPGESELDVRPGTLPQALLRMNGKLVKELSDASPMTASGRLQIVQRDSDKLVETAFLSCLTRRPTDAERTFFVGEFENRVDDPANRSREQIVEDLYWTLFNSPEFSWVR